MSEEYEPVAQLVKDYAKSGVIVVELGTYVVGGNSSARTLLQVVKEAGGRLYSVDWLRGSETIVNAPNAPESYGPETAAELWRNIQEDLDVFTFILGTTDNASLIFADRSVDVVWMDADHRYSQFKHDILVWWPKVKVGGWLTGHDMDCWPGEADTVEMAAHSEEDSHQGTHYGVARALGEMFNPGCLKGDPARRFWCVKKESGALRF